MKLLLAAIALFLLPAPLPAAAQDGCDAIVDGATIAIRRRPLKHDVPDYARSTPPDAFTTVTCRIGEEGYLTNCVAPLHDDRGPWLVRQFNLWKVLDREAAGCPLIGRSVRFKVWILMHEPALVTVPDDVLLIVQQFE